MWVTVYVACTVHVFVKCLVMMSSFRQLSLTAGSCARPPTDTVHHSQTPAAASSAAGEFLFVCQYLLSLLKPVSLVCCSCR